MKRRGVSVATTLTLVVTLLAGGASARPLRSLGGTPSNRSVIHPILQRTLATAGPDRMIDALVVLKAQSDLSEITSTKRIRRLSDVERKLTDDAATSQTGLLGFLHARRAQGLVANIVPLWIFDGIEITATRAVIDELAARSDVRELQPDRRFFAPATTTFAPPESNVSLTNAPALWNLGFRGQGIVVANLDTGVDLSHPELARNWRGGTNSWFDPNGEHPTTPTDVSGHGTWTMGVMVGGDAGGSSIGMAPDANWIAAKIFNDRGVATSAGIHLAFQWLLDPDGNPATADAPNVVNNSWTMSTFGCNLDFQLDLRSLRAAGILPVFAAGNYGPNAGTSVSPANNPEAFAVGATDDSDMIDPSSGRGPSACDQRTYPRLVAPGVGVRTTDLYGSYSAESGTSMAAPHVTGALALLLDAFPGLAADRQAGALESSGVDLGSGGPDNVYGFGRLDVLAGYTWLLSAPDFTVDASPSSASTSQGGIASYTVSVDRMNGFGGDVSLSLSGLSGSQASWTFSPPVVAGGSGTSQLTVTTLSTLAPGSYSLSINGTSGPISRTASATLLVSAPPDFGITTTPASQSVVAGASATYSVGVTSINGFAAYVTLSLSGFPSSVGAWSFAPAVVSGGGNSQLMITTPATDASGTYPLTIVGASGSTTHTTSATLVVSAPPDFSLSLSPSSRTILRGKPASFKVTVSSIGGFTDTVSLSVSGLPSGATASFKPVSVAAPGSSVMTVKTTSKTARGTFTLTVTGLSGSIAHRGSTTLIVK